MCLKFKILALLVLSIFLDTSSLASPLLDQAHVPATHGIRDMATRASAECADPALAGTLIQGYDGAATRHDLEFRANFIIANGRIGPSAAFWTFQGAAFRAFPTNETSTVPLFRMGTPANDDFMFVVGVDRETPPVVSGFVVTGLSAWVYATAVCGSVPLMSAVLAPQSDHYYTTDMNEHHTLMSVGWTDGGVVAFVLPLVAS